METNQGKDQETHTQMQGKQPCPHRTDRKGLERGVE